VEREMREVGSRGTAIAPAAAGVKDLKEKKKEKKKKGKKKEKKKEKTK
jgi:hypothetical protein